MPPHTGDERLQELCRNRQVSFVDRKERSVVFFSEALCTIMLTMMFAADTAENTRLAIPGTSGNIRQGHFRLLSLNADAADYDVFHIRRFLARDGARVAVKARSDLERDTELFSELDCARLHHFGPCARHLEQFIVRDVSKLRGFGDDTRVAGEDAVHIRKNLTRVRVQRPS